MCIFLFAGKIQVTEETAKILEDVYQFEYRDTIFVKGKGNMKTYLLEKKKNWTSIRKAARHGDFTCDIIPSHILYEIHHSV